MPSRARNAQDATASRARAAGGPSAHAARRTARPAAQPRAARRRTSPPSTGSTAAPGRGGPTPASCSGAGAGWRPRPTREPSATPGQGRGFRAGRRARRGPAGPLAAPRRTGCRGRLVGDDVSGVRPVEEEATQHEEDGDPDVHAGQEARKGATPGGAGEEPRVGEQHGNGRNGPQPLELEQVVRPPRRDGGGWHGRGTHEPAPTVTTWAEVTHTPAVLGVSTVR